MDPGKLIKSENISRFGVLPFPSTFVDIDSFHDGDLAEQMAIEHSLAEPTPTPQGERDINSKISNALLWSHQGVPEKVVLIMFSRAGASLDDML